MRRHSFIHTYIYTLVRTVHVYKLPRSNAQYEGPLSLDREMGYIAVRLDSTPEMLMAFMMEKGTNMCVSMCICTDTRRYNIACIYMQWTHLICMCMSEGVIPTYVLVLHHSSFHPAPSSVRFSL